MGRDGERATHYDLVISFWGLNTLLVTGQLCGVFWTDLNQRHVRRRERH